MIVPWGNLSPYSFENMVPFEEIVLEQLTLKDKIFHPFCSWMKTRVQEKIQIQDLWIIMGIRTIMLVFFL